MKIKQSVCLPMVKPAEASMAEFLAGVAEIGYKAVEIWTRDDSFETLARSCSELGLAIASMIGHSGGLNDPSLHDRIESELRQSVDVASRHRIPGVICFSGNRRDGVAEAAAMADTARGLRRVAPYAEEKGVNLNLELLNSKVDHAGYQCDRTAWGVTVCEQVNSPRVTLLYDIYHMQIMEGDIIRTLRENIRWIGHFHTAGVPGRRDLDDSQELNYAAICEAIAATDYALYVGHEFSPKGNALQALKQAFATCDKG